MDLQSELTREGVRGGREQFKWESLAGQKNRDRQNYLGVTAKLGVTARFGKYNTNDWWRNGKDKASESVSLLQEKNSVKQMENQLMMEALGVKPKQLMLAKSHLDMNDLSSSRDSRPKQEPEEPDESRNVSGLGFRKYLKPTDWSGDVCDVDEEEVLAPNGEVISAERPSPKREFFPQKPPVKEEQATELRTKTSSRRRSRSRENVRAGKPYHSR